MSFREKVEESSQLKGGEKAAYKMGQEHARRGTKLNDDAVKRSFGDYHPYYHLGHKHMSSDIADSEHWHSKQRVRGGMAEAEGDPCWKGYEQYGMKEKNGKKVPNCIKKESMDQDPILTKYLKLQKRKRYQAEWYQLHSLTETQFGQRVISALTEKMDADASIGDYVKDFSKSDAPQFKGKSQKKRRQMAIAAYYGSERNEGGSK